MSYIRSGRCPACQGPMKEKRCCIRQGDRGDLVYCRVERYNRNLPNVRYVGECDTTDSSIYAMSEDVGCYEGEAKPSSNPAKSKAEEKHPELNWYNSISKLARDLTAADAKEITDRLGVPLESARHYKTCNLMDETGSPSPQAFVIEEYGYGPDGERRQVAWHVRNYDDFKWSCGAYGLPSGFGRGLVLLDVLRKERGPIYLVEGATGAIAVDAMDLNVIGRPGCSGGLDFMVQFLASQDLDGDQKIIVVCDNDPESHAGEIHGNEFAARLSKRLNRKIGIAQAPQGGKDSRDWFKAAWSPGMDPHTLGKAYHAALGTIRYIKPEQAKVGAEKPLPATIAAAIAVVLPLGLDEEKATADLTESMRQAIAASKAKAQAYDPYAEENEAAAARRIAEMRRNQDAYRCHCCRALVLRHQETGDPYLSEVRCEKWSGCPGCRLFLRDRELTSARWHFGNAPAVFEGGVSEENWQAMRRRIRRAGGQYHRTRDGHGADYYVVANVNVYGLIPCTVQTAWQTVHVLLVLHPEDCGERPITTSRGWCLPQQETSGLFSLLGQASTMTADEVIEIAERFSATAFFVRGHDPAERIQRMWRFGRRDGWDADTREELAQALYAGNEVDVSNVEFTFANLNWRRTKAEPDVFLEALFG